MEEFTVTSRITKKEFIKLSLVRIYTKPMFAFVTICGLGMLALSLANMFGFYDELSEHSNNGKQLFITAFGFYTLAAPLFMAYSAGKLYDRTPLLNTDAYYTFSTQAIVTEAKGLQSAIDWGNIVKHEEVGGFMLFYTSPATAIMVKKSIFSSQQIQYINQQLLGK